MNRVKVVHIVPALFGRDGGIFGGAERYAFELARFMAKEVSTTLVSFDNRARAENVDGLTIRIIGNANYVKDQRTNPIAGVPLLSELRKGSIIHCHQQHVLLSSVAALYGRCTGRKVFVTDLGGGGWDISAYVSTDAWFHGHLHISEYSRKIFGHTASGKAHVILGGVDIEKFSPDPTVPKNGTILFVGRLLPHKGIDDLIDAIPADMPLEVIGQPYDPQFYYDLQKLAANKRVHFRHDCGDAALVDAYRKAICVVLPSVYRTRYGCHTNVPELLGQTLLEGMACGTPVICTEVASMPEVVDHGVSGFVVPPNDVDALREKLMWLRDNPGSVREMGGAGRKRVLARFTWPIVVKRCLEIYTA